MELGERPRRGRSITGHHAGVCSVPCGGFFVTRKGARFVVNVLEGARVVRVKDLPLDAVCDVCHRRPGAIVAFKAEEKLLCERDYFALRDTQARELLAGRATGGR